MDPKIYVGTYAKYNTGSLGGAWIDLDGHDARTFAETIAKLHRDEHDPEYMYQDWEDVPKGMISESHISPELWEWLELDEHDRRTWSVYREHVDSSGDWDAARDAFVDKFDSPEDYAIELAEHSGDLSQIPERYHDHIDWKSVVRDMETSGFTFAYADYKYWIFWP